MATQQLSIRLEPFTHTDIDQLMAWIPSAEFLMQWAGASFYHPLDRAQLVRHLARAKGRHPASLIFKAVHPETQATVGHGELVGIDARNRSVTIARILVGPPELRGQGIGGQIVEGLVRIAFEEHSLHRVALNVFDFNRAAICCYEKVGFRREGVLRHARRLGDEYWNVCVMSMLEHEYYAGRE